LTKTAALLRVLRGTAPKVMLAYMNNGKTASAKRNNGQKFNIERKR
jgi:hypothetical protein